MRRVDVKEDTRDNNCLLLEQLFEESLLPTLVASDKECDTLTKPLLSGGGSFSRFSQM
jgi:hypothetical protein